MPHQRNTGVTQSAARSHQGLSSAVCQFVYWFFVLILYFTLCTLLGDLNLPATKVGLLDVLDAEVSVAL